MTDQMWQKCFEKFHAGDFSLDDGYSKVTRPVEVDSYQIETLRTINVIHMGDSHHTQNIETNKVIVENEKSFFYFTEKIPHKLFGQLNIYSSDTTSCNTVPGILQAFNK